jgi:hypothetical protein
MRNSKTKFAFVFHSCDAYEVLYKGCIYYFNKYWSSEIPVTKYFITEEKDVHFAGFKNIKSGTGAWTSRLHHAVSQIDEPYIIYFQEDYWLTQKVEPSYFEKIMAAVEKLNPALLKLHDQTGDYKFLENAEVEVEGLSMKRLDVGKSDFILSHRASIWRKDFFLNQLILKESPWQNEMFGTQRLRKTSEKIYMLDYLRDNEKGKIDSPDFSHYYTVAESGKLNHFTSYFIENIKKDKLADQDMVEYMDQINAIYASQSPLVQNLAKFSLIDRAKIKWNRLVRLNN